MNQRKITSLPNLAIILIFLVYIATNFYHHNWTRDKGPIRGVIKWDVISYYAYLPATFIYHDIGLNFVSDEDFNNDNKFWFQKTETGKNIIITSMGLSYLYAPFFFAAHFLAPVFGEPRNGFNSIYQFFLVFSSLFYVVLGLYFLRKILSKYFNEKVTAITLFLIGLGTNLYYYTTYEAAVSHAYSFAFISILLYFIIEWYIQPKYTLTILIGLIYGLVALIRPSNIVFLLVLLLWGIKDWKDLPERFFFFLRNSHKVLIMLFFFLIPWIPQFVYWKNMTGSFIYNSYNQVGSAFYFDHPHIIEMLFSYRKGWFIYTPIMFLACLGVIPLYKKIRESFLSILIYSLVMVYLLSSWWSWWFGGSFGIRAMVDIYGVLALPLAAFVSWMYGIRSWLRYGILLLVAFLVFLNVFQTWQYSKGLIHWVGMTKESYWLNFVRKSDAPGYWQKLSIPDFQLARKGIYVFYDTGATNERLKTMPESDAKKMIETKVRNDAKLMRDIRKYSKRNNTDNDSSVLMVVERIYTMKTED